MAIEPHLAGGFALTPVAPAAFTVSPELALVDGELREQALPLLPRVEPFAFLQLTTRTGPAPFDPYRGAPQVRSRPPRIVAALSYLLVAVLRVSVFNACVFVGVAVLVFLLNLVG
ncbi:MAG: hypothetical protein ACXVQ3_04490 [Gaiellaceae bacterium]